MVVRDHHGIGFPNDFIEILHGLLVFDLCDHQGVRLRTGEEITKAHEVTSFAEPLKFQGTFTVSGRDAAGGVLRLARGRLSGTLGAKLVG